MRSGNIWDYYHKGMWIVIPTNGTVKANGTIVMGAGLAKQARAKFPLLASKLGKHVFYSGNTVYSFPEYRVLTYPVKHDWWQKADLALIEKSAHALVAEWNYVVDVNGISPPVVALPCVGCGNGGRSWPDEVRPILQGILDERFLVIYNDTTAVRI